MIMSNHVLVSWPLLSITLQFSPWTCSLMVRWPLLVVRSMFSMSVSFTWNFTFIKNLACFFSRTRIWIYSNMSGWNWLWLHINHITFHNTCGFACGWCGKEVVPASFMLFLAKLLRYLLVRTNVRSCHREKMRSRLYLIPPTMTGGGAGACCLRVRVWLPA